MILPDLSRRALAVTLAASLLLSPLAAHAQSCDPGTEARLDFLETRLAEGQSNARLWWRSWLAVFTIGLLYKGTTGAVRGDGSNAAADWFAAGKSAIGIAELTLRSHVGRHGADRVRAIAKTSPDNCAQRLRLAEHSLELAAGDAGGRWSWIRHVTSLLLNIGTSVAVDAGWDDDGTAWRDFAVSQVSSELHIFTHPTRAVDDWAEYRRQFDGTPEAAAASSFHLAATRGGLGFVWKF
jgi:hypothetical protein